MKKTQLSADEQELFRDAVAGIKPMAQDTIAQAPRRRPAQPRQQLRQRAERQAGFYFSDDFEPLFAEGWPNYVREDVSTGELKKLRRGDYYPEMTLDLHGMSREEAKVELAALIERAIQDHVLCCCVMHGIGTGALKRKVPAWLAQHPKVQAMHSAPREFGGQGALLILLELAQ
ncbi:endonuclease SmrB [Gallaecimonas sp. GXIMD4217]|uniref:endonuclease SmrB n=1 Tax=Gallaecimonas sp. GXIMD4217 TaxID=3131927 RepID=UPI00311AE016